MSVCKRRDMTFKNTNNNNNQMEVRGRQTIPISNVRICKILTGLQVSIASHMLYVLHFLSPSMAEMYHARGSQAMQFTT